MSRSSCDCPCGRVDERMRGSCLPTTSLIVGRTPLAPKVRWDEPAFAVNRSCTFQGGLGNGP